MEPFGHNVGICSHWICKSQLRVQASPFGEKASNHDAHGVKIASFTLVDLSDGSERYDAAIVILICFRFIMIASSDEYLILPLVAHRVIILLAPIIRRIHEGEYGIPHPVCIHDG